MDGRRHSQYPSHFLNQSAAGTGGLGIRIVSYCQQVFISIYSKLSVIFITIALDKIPFSIKKYGYFSYFSMKTYLVLI